jgi:XTP/dITP diphosphohydrolase
MKKQIVLATRNRGKITELKALMQDFGIEVLSVADMEGVPEVEEDATTFLENSLKKAREISTATGIMALADDSGLVVDALNGAPGVYSARYAGDDATDEQNYLKLLDEIKDIPDGERTARFKCVMVLYHPSGQWISAEGACEGIISHEPTGSQGFGYDPVFFVPELGRSMAQLSSEEKNAISHRGNALKKLREMLPEFLEKVGEKDEA